MSPAVAPPRLSPAVLAGRAMRQEVLLTPKPGLVDRRDRGAHRDMDHLLFLTSAEAVLPFLEDMAGAAPEQGSSLLVLPVIRPIGVEAEKAMFRATRGINTHKGQIFSLGVCLAAAKRVRAAGEGTSPLAPRILEEAGRICRGITGELLHPGAGTSQAPTNGRSVFRQYGCTGIRGEGEKGFPSVGNVALPAFREAETKGLSPEKAALEALLRLMTVTEDSNVLHRRGAAGLSLMRRQAASFLDSGGMAREDAPKKLEEMNRLFIRENISPGGCADLLALTLFLISLEDAPREQARLSA